VEAGGLEVFLCLGCQGGRGDDGSWLAVMVDDVDAVHKQCVAGGLEVTFPPTDMPWNMREMHLRHPDGHMFRVGTSLEEGEDETS
jgi:uncharacterized glyoxalase superfamily protein PhnB